MKILKWVFGVLGVAGIIAGSVLLVSNLWNISVIYRVAIANQSSPSVTDPSNWVMWMALAAVLGGFCLGLGLGLPVRRRAQVEGPGKSAAAAVSTPQPPSIPGV